MKVKPHLLAVGFGLIMAAVDIQNLNNIDIFIIVFLLLTTTAIEIIEYIKSRRE